MTQIRHFFFFFFNDTATTEIYTLSLHDALPISGREATHADHQRRTTHHVGRHAPTVPGQGRNGRRDSRLGRVRDRKSTRLNSSHLVISYAVFCLKKKTQSKMTTARRYWRNPYST